MKRSSPRFKRLNAAYMNRVRAVVEAHIKDQPPVSMAAITRHALTPHIICAPHFCPRLPRFVLDPCGALPSRPRRMLTSRVRAWRVVPCLQSHEPLAGPHARGRVPPSRRSLLNIGLEAHVCQRQ